MAEQPRYMDDLQDLHDAVGDTTDLHREVRLACLDKAIAALPPHLSLAASVPETLVAARRFAEFALFGTTTRLSIPIESAEEVAK
jgi:hypothetical protein